MSAMAVQLGPVSLDVRPVEGGYVWRVYLGTNVYKWGKARTFWGAHKEAAQAAEGLS